MFLFSQVFRFLSISGLFAIFLNFTLDSIFPILFTFIIFLVISFSHLVFFYFPRFFFISFYFQGLLFFIFILFLFPILLFLFYFFYFIPFISFFFPFIFLVFKGLSITHQWFLENWGNLQMFQGNTILVVLDPNSYWVKYYCCLKKDCQCRENVIKKSSNWNLNFCSIVLSKINVRSSKRSGFFQKFFLFKGNLILGNLSSLSELSTEGKSGAFFYYTSDGSFMIKTVSDKEFNKLRFMLKVKLLHCLWVFTWNMYVKQANHGRSPLWELFVQCVLCPSRRPWYLPHLGL